MKGMDMGNIIQKTSSSSKVNKKKQQDFINTMMAKSMDQTTSLKKIASVIKVNSEVSEQQRGLHRKE